MSYLDKSIKEIHQAYVDGLIKPIDLVKEAIERAKANEDNCFEIIDEEGAIKAASELGEVEEGNLLWGIPYIAKDNFSTKGLVTTASSNILNGYVPLFDATVVSKLKETKAVLIGKSTLDELAMGGTGTTGHLGITYNPYGEKHQRMIGGSSCGSASAAASAITPFSLGSDTGDSVRKPASLGGLVGFKPTWGRISRYGLFPFAPSLDHVGYFTRSVDDAAIILSAIAGRDEMDYTSSLKPVDDYLGKINEGVSGKKIIVIKEIVDSIKDGVLLEKFNKSLGKLKESGALVEEVEFGKDLLSAVYATYFVISCAEATSNNANLDGIKFGPFQAGKTYQEVMTNARSKGFSELIRRRFVMGSFALMSENQDELFRRAQKARRKIVDRVNEILKDADAILTPAAPSIAPKFGEKGDRLSDEYLIADNHLALGNFSGLPSITLPLGFEDGMPLGINLMGKAFDEANLLAISKSFEDITGLAGLSVLSQKEGNL